MASAREVKLRIRSVKNIAQVTRALEAVSASYVRTATQAVMATRDYAGRAFNILNSLASQSGDLSRLHPLLQQRPVEHIGMVLISSDRGLAGPYNMNIVGEALNAVETFSQPVRWITIGNKGRDLIYRSGANVVAAFTNYTRPPGIVEIGPIARQVLDDFLNGEVDQVYLAYTDFISTARQIPRVSKLLPFGLGEEDGDGLSEHLADREQGVSLPYIYEPDAEELLNVILPRFTELQIYQALLESLASEHSARMTAMHNATENAGELADGLQLAYNKARQLAITSDMLDIAGGAEALAQASK